MSQETGFRFPAGERQLFLDDFGIARIDDLQRTMHRPAKKGAVIRPNWAIGEAGVYTRSAPVWDPEAILAACCVLGTFCARRPIKGRLRVKRTCVLAGDQNRLVGPASYRSHVALNHSLRPNPLRPYYPKRRTLHE